jgi:ribosome-binding protein aMBF1 (putative translation factor)
MTLKPITIGSLSFKALPIMIGDTQLVCLKPEEYQLVSERIRLEQLVVEFINVSAPELGKKVAQIFQAEEQAVEALCLTATDNSKSTDIFGAFVEEANARLRQPDDSFISLEEVKKEFALDEIVKAREAAGMTQKMLAQKAGLTQPQLSKLEKNPLSASIGTIRKLAKVLNVKVVL